MLIPVFLLPCSCFYLPFRIHSVTFVSVFFSPINNAYLLIILTNICQFFSWCEATLITVQLQKRKKKKIEKHSPCLNRLYTGQISAELVIQVSVREAMRMTQTSGQTCSCVYFISHLYFSSDLRELHLVWRDPQLPGTSKVRAGPLTGPLCSLFLEV